MNPKTIAVDLAKHVFEVATVDEHSRVGHRRLTRAQFGKFLCTTPSAHVVMEACGAAHHWGRLAQSHGHRVSLLPPQYVRPFVRRQKTDRTDTLGLLDAQRSLRLLPVAVKTIAQQEILALHRIRQQWIATRTARINALHGLLGEYGIHFPVSTRRVIALVSALLDDAALVVPERLRRMLALVLDEVRALNTQIGAVEQELQQIADNDPVIERVMSVPGLGVLTATSLVAAVGSIQRFRRARRLASWVGLTPRECSSGETRHLGAITKAGDHLLRAMLVQGARAVLLAAQRTQTAGRSLTNFQQWALRVAERRGSNRAAIAVANKMVRMVWAVWAQEVPYTPQRAA